MLWGRGSKGKPAIKKLWEQLLREEERHLGLSLCGQSLQKFRIGRESLAGQSRSG